jgi:hypothetical protein
MLPGHGAALCELYAGVRWTKAGFSKVPKMPIAGESWRDTITLPRMRELQKYEMGTI